MKIHCLFCAVLFLAGVLPAVAQPAAAAKSPFEQAMMASEKSLIEAKKKDDGAFFKRTLAADFSLVGIDGKLLEGQEAVDNLGDSGLLELTPYDIKVLALSDAAALITYDAIVRAKGLPYFSTAMVSRVTSLNLCRYSAL